MVRGTVEASTREQARQDERPVMVLDWFEDWFVGKLAKNAHTATLVSYLRDLEFFRDDPAKLSISIQR